jgi:hypothetical protein
LAPLLISSSSETALGEERCDSIGLIHDNSTGIAYILVHLRNQPERGLTCSTAVRAEKRESVSRDWSSRDWRVAAGSLEVLMLLWSV